MMKSSGYLFIALIALVFAMFDLVVVGCGKADKEKGKAVAEMSAKKDMSVMKADKTDATVKKTDEAMKPEGTKPEAMKADAKKEAPKAVKAKPAVKKGPQKDGVKKAK